jgi:bifunctional DNase/RNase
MIRLDLMSVGMIEETGGILLILRAPELARLLVIETGPLEGRAIALEAEGVRSERPLTQDLLFTIVTKLGAQVKEVQIQEFHDETFYARVMMNDTNGKAVEVDARPSDAIALAMRAGAPIYVAENVIAELGQPEDRNGRFNALYPDDEDEDEENAGRIVH